MIQRHPLFLAVWEQQRIKLLLTLLLLLIVTGTFSVQRWIVEPNLQELSTEQFSLQQHVRQRQVDFANSGVPISMAERIEKNLQQFNELIPPLTDFSLFLGELFDWSHQAKLEIHQVNYRPEPDEETGYFRYGLSFSVKGKYHQVKKFIHLLENSDRILIIDKISLAGSLNDKKTDSVDLRIVLTTYFQGESL